MDLGHLTPYNTKFIGQVTNELTCINTAFSMKKTKHIFLFLQFAGLSGLGWLLDISILLTLVSAFKLDPSLANMVSSCTAALAVFLLSRELIFNKASKVLSLRITIYLIYTLSVIVVASIAIGMIVPILRPLAGNIIGEWTLVALVGVAKIIVTPPQLIMNFYMSRFISERQFSR